MALPAVLAPIGLGIYGASLQYHLHFMVLALGFFLNAFAALLSVPICLNYVIECFIANANEAAIAMNVYRLGFAICLSFFVFEWEADVGGPGWVFGMAAFFDLFVALLIAVVVWKGHVLRKIAKGGLVTSEAGQELKQGYKGEEHGTAIDSK